MGHRDVKQLMRQWQEEWNSKVFEQEDNSNEESVFEEDAEPTSQQEQSNQVRDVHYVSKNGQI